MKNPEYFSLQVSLLVVFVAVAGYFVIDNLSDQRQGQAGRVIVSPVKVGDVLKSAKIGKDDQVESHSDVLGTDGKVALDVYDFTAICADGQPHIHVLSPNEEADYKITNSFQMTWETCNIPIKDGAPQISLKLKYDSTRMWAYKTTGDKVLTCCTNNNGSLTLSLAGLGGYGGFYKIEATAMKAVKVPNGPDPGEYDLEYQSTGATDQSDDWFMIYEDDNYLTTTGTKNYTCNGFDNLVTTYYRIPKSKTSVTIEIVGGGGGYGGKGGSGSNYLMSQIIKYYGSGGGGGGAGSHLTAQNYNVFSGGIMKVDVGCAGSHGSKGGDTFIPPFGITAGDGTSGQNGSNTTISGAGLSTNLIAEGGGAGSGGIGGSWTGFPDGGAGGISNFPVTGPGQDGSAGFNVTLSVFGYNPNYFVLNGAQGTNDVSGILGGIEHPGYGGGGFKDIDPNTGEDIEANNDSRTGVAVISW